MRIAAGEADLVLGCDMVVVNDYWALSKIRAGRTQVVLNTYEAMPGTFTTRPDMQFPAADIVAGGAHRARRRRAASRCWSMRPQLATALMGDAIATNLFMLGYAWQQGLVPLSFDSIMRAVELNGAAVEMNKTAFAWGRLAALDPDAVADAAGVVRNAPTPAETAPRALPMLAPTASEGRESGLIAAVRAICAPRTNCATCPGRAVSDSVEFLPLDDLRLSRSLDELIARRIAVPHRLPGRGLRAALRGLRRQNRSAEARERTRLHRPDRSRRPLPVQADGLQGRIRSRAPVHQRRFQAHASSSSSTATTSCTSTSRRRCSRRRTRTANCSSANTARGCSPRSSCWRSCAFLRGTALDVFGYTAERRGERQLIADYIDTIVGLLAALDAGNVALAVEIASVPEHIRGYGHVKEAHLHRAKAREAELLAHWREPQHVTHAA